MNAAARCVHETITESATTTAESASDLESLSTICRWTSKRISAVEGSHLVLARYSQKSSTASQDDEAAGLPLQSALTFSLGGGKLDAMITFVWTYVTCKLIFIVIFTIVVLNVQSKNKITLKTQFLKIKAFKRL